MNYTCQQRAISLLNGQSSVTAGTENLRMALQRKPSFNYMQYTPSFENKIFTAVKIQAFVQNKGSLTCSQNTATTICLDNTTVAHKVFTGYLSSQNFVTTYHIYLRLNVLKAKSMFQLLNRRLQKGVRFINFSRPRHLFTKKQPQSESQPVAGQGNIEIAVMISRKRLAQTQSVQQVTQGNALYSNDWCAVLMRQLLRRTRIGSA